MADHVHLLLSFRRNRDGWPYPLVDILQCLRSVTAHRINKMLRVSVESLKEKCEYIRQNPVRKGLVTRPEEYQRLWVDPDLG
jgi:hypothetical protein